VLVELAIGRELREAERAIDVIGIDSALNKAKDDLEAAIEKEKRRVVRAIMAGRVARLRPTSEMAAVLRRLHRLGKREAALELDRLGYPRRALAVEPLDFDEELGPLAARLRTLLGSISARVHNEVLEVGLSDVAASAVLRAALRVPGARDAASRIISSAFTNGLTATFETYSEIVSCWEYSAVLDAGVCERCRQWDGERFYSLATLYAVLPDFGPNPECLGDGRCRCRAVPCPAGETA
jgi:hypothetical protein